MKSWVEKLWADFYEWPEKWKGFPEDVAYGVGIIEIYKSFVEQLLSRYSMKTARRHLDNLWLLGGELIRNINMDPEDREKTTLSLQVEPEIGDLFCPV